MLRTTSLLLATACALAGSSYAQESPSVFELLSKRAMRMAAELPPVPDSVDAWEKHRAGLVEKLAATLGLPGREPMKAAVTDTREDGDLVVEKVVYLWAERAYVSATVIRTPQPAARRPAVVIPPGFQGHYTFLPHRKLVDSLVRQGLLVLFIDDPRTGLRHAPRAGLYATAAAAGTPVAGVQVFDALRGLDYLLTRADVDPGKIGIAGYAEGALQATMAAAIEPRFRFVVALDGMTTYEAMVQAAAAGAGPEDPSAFVAGILDFADMDRVGACLAPRPVLVAGRAGGGEAAAAGYARVLGTMRGVYKLYDAEDRLAEVAREPLGEVDSTLPEITRWLETSVLPAFDTSDAPPHPCAEPEEPDFSMLRYFQRRIAAQAESLPFEPASEAAWQEYRKGVVAWLGASCGVGLKPVADQVVEVDENDGLATEHLVLGVDAEWRCPAVLVRPAEPGPTPRAAVVLSHDARQCTASARIAEAARRLAAAGCVVIVPEHASPNPQSAQTLADPEQPSFYSDEAARFYGPTDSVGLPPLALRVAEDLAAVRHLAARAEVDAKRVVVAGLGLGGVDACLAGVLDERIAGVASIDATTMRDWAAGDAPEQSRFFDLMPYLPSMLAQTDLDLCYGAMAPRPLVVVRRKDGWPRSGFEQVATTASGIYGLCGAEDALLTLGPREVTEEREAATPEGVQRLLVAAARTLVPTPPTPGIVGTLDELKSRATTDSASGLIWIVNEASGYDQEFVGDGYRLTTWSFFNDNGDAQKGRMITPLVFKREGDKYVLTAIGTTRTNDGTGVQTFSFEPVEGSDTVGEGHFFGWHTGDTAGNHNPGVVEFQDAPDALMTILTIDGQMGGQKLKVGASYRVQSQYRRHYSVMAVSKK